MKVNFQADSCIRTITERKLKENQKSKLKGRLGPFEIEEMIKIIEKIKRDLF